MEIWDLDKERTNKTEALNWIKKHQYHLGNHDSLKINDIVYFKTGFNDHIPAKAKVKGINGSDIYVYNDCYWYPINFSRITKIESNNL
jgi:hypothetical protein